MFIFADDVKSAKTLCQYIVMHRVCQFNESSLCFSCTRLPGFVHESVVMMAITSTASVSDPVRSQSVHIIVEDLHHVWLHVVEADGMGTDVGCSLGKRVLVVEISLTQRMVHSTTM